MPDIESECGDCKNKFVTTEGEQVFYSQKNFDLPKRCFFCRKKRRQEKRREVI